MVQNLDKEQIDAVFYSQVLGHLGCHAEGVTYVIPICYAYDGTYIYGRTYEGMKINIIRKNPEVCFQVESIKNMIQWQSVIGWGKFEELKNDDVRNNAILVLQSRISAVVDSSQLKTSPYWPFAAPGTKGIVFRVHLIEKTGRWSL
ncbi:pyridoxamine 5'-phosphate oxidase family protein [Niabella beijingensis]|uniref:pyridoxamine 5'-phosphate oxidase family protein n=1 Tax=Niabella beijingensis TaxID=2872700 RepID=UPI001CBD3C5A|nr:pyridoxamine 5'-phosphate oxidase family protein [Niabella beijingensis]MBZ4188919.1 pyridoxamine 5'-phosphate oxidase family protein [Niabella beijingensis]